MAADYPGIDAELLDPLPHERPGPWLRFWLAERTGLRVAFETSTGTAWGPTGKRLPLLDTYARQGRDITQLSAEVLRLGRVASS